MKIFFDVDYTILCVNGTLRPWAREVFQWLKRDGHDIYIWSGTGIRKREMERLQLDSMVTDYFKKPLWEGDRTSVDYQSFYRSRLPVYGVPFSPDFVVDDYPEISEAFPGVSVIPYFSADSADEELLRVYQAIVSYTQQT